MADADEDTFDLPGSNAGDVDLSDETQDFRFLNALNFSSAHEVKIPKRGEKDFEPHRTSLQSSTLDASREAMHAALSTPRIHKPKAHQFATYDPESNMAYVANTKGSWLATMGTHEKGRLRLLPEEALHLLERGDLDIRWPINNDQEEEGDEYLGVPMSLQGAYAAFIGMERVEGRKLTLEMYTVYSALKRGGYTVMRTEDWDAMQPSLNTTSSTERDPFSFTEFFRRLFLAPAPATPSQLAHGPLIKPGLYRSYKDIHQLLTIVPTHDLTKPPTYSLPPESDNPFRPTYNLWKPNAGFKKRAPPPPSFCICVINARETPVPTLSQMNDMLATAPYDPPQKGRQLEASLKQGHRNVILAVVDQGITSYLRFSDAGFAHDPLYERKQRQGGKRGGRGGGRGRGRGR